VFGGVQVEGKEVEKGVQFGFYTVSRIVFDDLAELRSEKRIAFGDFDD
jgi:hypothetical protein